MSIHWKVLIGIVLGLLVGFAATYSNLGTELVLDYIKPIGVVFIKILKLIAVPLVFVSLTKGITELKDIKRLSALGGRTIFWFLATTFGAVLLGLLLVNVFKPGVGLDIAALQSLSSDSMSVNTSAATDRGPLDFFVRMVPDNLFSALSDNGRLLQVIFFTVLFSIALLLIPHEDQQPIVKLISSLNKVLVKIVDIIIACSPYAVFALMATLIVEIKDPAIFRALVNYSAIMLLGLFMILLSYPLLVKWRTGMPMSTFVKGVLPAQMVALTTSSSMATLPVTMESLQENLNVDEEVVSFVCPVGATINMDATSLMQSLAAVFVCQIIGMELSMGDQMTIILTASMASIGAAAAPSAGIVMLVMVLESVGFPSEQLPIALTLILAVDRPLDMCRTVVNITGDCCVSTIVNSDAKLKT